MGCTTIKRALGVNEELVRFAKVHGSELRIRVDLMTVASGTSTGKAVGWLWFSIALSLAAAVLGLSLNRQVWQAWTMHARRVEHFWLFEKHNLHGWLGPGEYWIKDSRPFLRLYFMYTILVGNPSLRRSRLRTFPLHDSLFIAEGTISRDLITVTLPS